MRERAAAEWRIVDERAKWSRLWTRRTGFLARGEVAGGQTCGRCRDLPAMLLVSSNRGGRTVATEIGPVAGAALNATGRSAAAQFRRRCSANPPIADPSHRLLECVWCLVAITSGGPAGRHRSADGVAPTIWAIDRRPFHRRRGHVTLSCNQPDRRSRTDPSTMLRRQWDGRSPPVPLTPWARLAVRRDPDRRSRTNRVGVGRQSSPRSAARSAASVSSSTSASAARTNQRRASLSRPAASSASA